MIRRVTSDEELKSIWESSKFFRDKTNAEALKIYALWLCYGIKYDFCRFYISDGAVIGGLDGSFVVSEYSDCGECDFEEMADFFSMNGFNEIFCSEHTGHCLSKKMSCRHNDVYLMRFDGIGVQCVTENDTPLKEFYGILKSGFDIEFEPWYLDMSHRIRHGVACTRRLNGSVLVIQYNIFGSALISQVATIPPQRGNGNASRLISAVCAELSDSEIFVICEDKLCGFYEKNGFTKVCNKTILRSV